MEHNHNHNQGHDHNLCHDHSHEGVGFTPNNSHQYLAENDHDSEDNAVQENGENANNHN
ncbi:MAG: hypothetical protein RSB05_01420 [Clostridiales bacterium]